MSRKRWAVVLIVGLVLVSTFVINTECWSGDIATAVSNNPTPTVRGMQLTGALSTSIPIQIPPGRAGLQPNLALNYSSYRKNGWVGVGWDMGLGAIVRSSKHGVDYNASEFVSNGQELVPLNIDGAGNGSYRSKIEGDFAQFEFNHATGWVMTLKSGIKYFFGQDTSSRQDDPGNSDRVFKWCLDKVLDINGNYMMVTYEKDQGQIYLKRIDYTGAQRFRVGYPRL